MTQVSIRNLIWEIAKSGEEDLTNTELQAIEEPEELVVARGLSLEAKDSTTGINKRRTCSPYVMCWYFKK